MLKTDMSITTMLALAKSTCRNSVLLLLSGLPAIGGADSPARAIYMEQETSQAAPGLPVYVGVRDDARPFSYETPTGSAETVLAGFSGYMVSVCRYILKQMKAQPEYANLEFRAYKVDATKRFDTLNDGKVLFLCGPDSITDELLDRFRPTLPVFLSGMTYAYVDPRSPLFPKGNYCGNVIGVVRGTTADKHGLRELTEKNLLMRFNKAVDLELSKQTGKDKMADDEMRKIIKDFITEFHRLPEYPYKLQSSYSKRDVRDLENILSNRDPERIHTNVDRLENTRLSGFINEKMGERFGKINREIAKTIQTDECPRGFGAMPIRKYRDHTTGVQKFCEGQVLYYLGDYDIINNKIREHSNCKATMNRFTRTKEVYGVFFADRDLYCLGNHENSTTTESCAEDPPSSGTSIDVLRFFSEFNALLFKAMQGKESAVEKIFSKTFIGQEKSEELHDFFQNFKIASFDD